LKQTATNMSRTWCLISKQWNSRDMTTLTVSPTQWSPWVTTHSQLTLHGCGTVSQ